LGATYEQILTSDRAKAYGGFLPRLRQICWAHVRRDFQTMIDRGGDAARVGRALLGHADVLFGWWYRVRDGTLARSTFDRDVMSLLRPAFRADLEAGTKCGCAKTAATCRELLKVEMSLWTFVRHAGIEPTNNAAERSLRHGVIWRDISFGTQSDGGSRFVESILTVFMTCKQQQRNVLDYITACCKAARSGDPAPSLLPTVAGASAA
jgi:transposase